MASLRQSSVAEWNSTGTAQEINTGSLQRIADATEKMAANWVQLVAERDKYKRWYEEGIARQMETRNAIEHKDHVIRGLRGAIKRMKGKHAK